MATNSNYQERLNFEMVLLKHMDRISELCTEITPDIQSNNPKFYALMLSINLLEANIPKKYIKKHYLEDLENLNKQFPDKNTQYYVEKYSLIINLLAKTGLLYKERKIAERDADGENEDWEE